MKHRKVLTMPLAAALVLGSAAVQAAGSHPAGAVAKGRSPHSADDATRTPIKHLVVIIGENRSFDHVFATYEPRPGERVWNLLSQGIVTKDGAPGPNFGMAEQQAATDAGADPFLLDPPKTGFAHGSLPTPLAGGPEQSYFEGDRIALARLAENDLPEEYYPSLVSGGTGLAPHTPDTRISHVASLPAGPYQLTNGSSLRYRDYTGNPTHRFYQMWQQMDCNAGRATRERPSGCDSRLFSWVEVTIGPGSNGGPRAANFSTDYAPGVSTTGEGATALGFYNVQHGDVPYFKDLADRYAMSDNFHQSVAGGTGVNHIMFGHGDVLWFSDAAGHPATPPHDQIENPNPAPGTNNWYIQDGYGAGSAATTFFGGGSYSACADASQPGVSALLAYLGSLRRPIDPHCEPGHYYLLNNYNPGYFGDGSDAFADRDPRNTPFTLPPSDVRSIGDSLNDKGVSWKYYGDHWNRYLGDRYLQNEKAAGAANDQYCNICNPFQYDRSIMTHAAVREAHLKDTADFYADIAAGRLPAVSIVKPSGLVDGHPASSKLDLFEGFSKKIVDAIKAHPALWRSSAILITFDEGGGYYDSGYVQPLDFFGDGTRIPLIAVSPFVKAGHIAHDYSDHVSILKLIEHNWGLAPVSARSRDNLPNPVPEPDNPYAPANTPAISDLLELFDFKQGH